MSERAVMAIRTSRTTVEFQSTFQLKSLDAPQPAGTYDVVTEEEIIEGNERTVYLRVATLLYVHSTGTTRIVTVDPTDLQEALAKDGRP